MPTIISHPAIALATLPFLRNISRKPLVIFSGILLTILPDVDVLAFKFGIPYGHVLGHRGFSHSIIFSLILSLILTLINKQLSFRKNLLVWGYLFICGLSHGLLDAMTNGGHGVGLLIPFSKERFFFETRPIEVATLSFNRFINEQGTLVLRNEFIYIWLPALVFLVSSYLLSKILTIAFKRP